MALFNHILDCKSLFVLSLPASSYRYRKLKMSRRRISSLNAILFFAFWLAVLYAGADHPPPRGFIWLVLLTLAAACLVYWRVGTYLTWIERGQPRYLLRVVGEGFVVGLAFALVASTASSLLGYGKPTVQPQMSSYLIWLFVVGVVGAATAAAIYLTNLLVDRLTRVR